MLTTEPIIVVLGPWCGGTSAVAQVLHHLGVFMGAEFDIGVRELDATWEDASLSLLCRRAFSAPGGQLQMDVETLTVRLQDWADNHRRAAHTAGRRPGVKHPTLCVAVDLVRAAWGPVLPIVVDRPPAKVVASLNRLGWWKDEQERAESTAHLLAERDRALDGVTTIRVDFEELRLNPAPAIRRLADELGFDVTATQFEAAVNSVIRQADVPHGIDPRQHLIARFSAELQNDPEDPAPVHKLAQLHFLNKDFANSRKYSARLIELGVQGEDQFLALMRIAQCMQGLGLPWSEVQGGYLGAWESRPTRAEPFYCIANHYRAEKRYRLGYLFAEHAARLPLPADDMVLPDPAIYAWRATDQLAECALGLGEYENSFALYRRLLSRHDIPDDDRVRMSANRDLCAPAMLEAALSGSKAFAHNVLHGQPDPQITVSVNAGSTLTDTAATLKSFLWCCTDVAQVGRFVVFDDGRSAATRASLQQLYPSLEFVECAVGAELRDHIRSRYWLHVDRGWRFFAPENYLARLIAILEAEPQVVGVGLNVANASTLNGLSAPERSVRRAAGAGRYVLADQAGDGPAMFDTERIARAGGNALCATLDEVVCVDFDA